MKNQPKIDIPVSSLERMLDSAALLFAGGALLLACFHYPNLPQEVPSHFNYKGEVDSFGSKNLIFVLPALAIVMALGIIYLSGFPDKFNYIKKITPENAAFEYKRARFTIRVLNVFTSLLFLVITWEIIHTVGKGASQMNALTYVLLVAMLIAPIGVYWAWPKQKLAD